MIMLKNARLKLLFTMIAFVMAFVPLPIIYLGMRQSWRTVPHWLCMHPEGWMAYFLYLANLGTLLVIWRQLSKLQTQIRLQALVELNKEWSYEKTMLGCRNNACNLLIEKATYFSALKKCPTKLSDDEKKLIQEGLSKKELIDIETVLEFFEKTSSFVKDTTLEVDAVWEVLGWYLVRYHYYFRDLTTKILRTYWTPNNNDVTLYSNTENVYKELIKKEKTERNISPETIEKEFDETRKKFVEYEKQNRAEK